jgi:uncharacterized glyoxalase superfamily protein PhnB
MAERTGFEGIVPILRVNDLSASIAYYVNVLGFTVDWKGAAIIASVSRDRCALMLCEGQQGHCGTWVWVGVDDVGELFEEYRAAGATIRMEPRNFEWAYEMRVEDLDGNVLRIGSEPRSDIPLAEVPD